MPRLRNRVNGGIVNVDEDLASALDSDWVSAEVDESKPGRRRRAARSGDAGSDDRTS